MALVPLILSLILAAGGAGMSYAANEEAKAAQEKAVKHELLRQRAREREAAPLLAMSTAASSPAAATKQLEAGRQKREQQYREVGQTQVGEYQPALQVPTMVATGNRLRQRAEASAMAMNQSYMDLAVNQALRNAGINRLLHTLGIRAGESADVLPYELQSAGEPGGLAYGGEMMSALAPLALYAGGGSGSGDKTGFARGGFKRWG